MVAASSPSLPHNPRTGGIHFLSCERLSPLIGEQLLTRQRASSMLKFLLPLSFTQKETLVGPTLQITHKTSKINIHKTSKMTQNTIFHKMRLKHAQRSCKTIKRAFPNVSTPGNEEEEIDLDEDERQSQFRQIKNNHLLTSGCFQFANGRLFSCSPNLRA